ncbi:hypothetical protein TD95_004926 [Thielaviopsis punctulata]|uniref:Peptidyl-prolyl cis-trans isomerase-like 2 n=1 Tax=Thielaviopsis punctulata TaxID=72032 RepID=A0A0F4ZA38_9PEZI|nr:hypothetical protein TD95_004926 [Thielaviopsis punctulata]
MGKGTDKLYITHSEWSSADAFSASGGAASRRSTAPAFRQLPFNFCAASLQPFENAVCTPVGTIFDVQVIGAWLEKHSTNPVDGEPLKAKDLIKLNFSRNDSGALVDPVTFKVFTDNTHIVAVRHGSYANVFAYDTLERMNIKPKMWRDLLDDAEFTRADLITLQDPQSVAARDLGKFKHLKDGGALLTPAQEAERKGGNVNVNVLGRIGGEMLGSKADKKEEDQEKREKVVRAKMAVEKARQSRDTDKAVALAKSTKHASATTAAARLINDKKLAANAAAYTTGKAAASFTSTGLTPETSGERALLTDEEFMLRPKTVKIKGYARIETNLGKLTIELHTDTAPRAVWNFVRLAQSGYYRNVAFHRNIPGFMIQGGDPSGTGRGGASIWGKNFQDEFDGPQTHNERGVLSMANKGKNTNGSQFFITYKAASHLDRKHTIFGKVIDGGGTKASDTLGRMEAAPTDGSDRPLNKIVIRDVVVYIDPFAEFQKERTEREKAEAKAAEGGGEDDVVTWTGKRLRGNGDGRVEEGSVGKYLKLGAGSSGETRTVEKNEEVWERPKKKARGFGNFDGW